MFELIVLIIFGITLILLSVWVLILQLRITRLTRNNDGVSLEDILNKNLTETRDLIHWCKKLDADSQLRDQQFLKSIQGVGFVRFNPFEDTGGNNSFACALVDAEGNGVVISSLFAREKMRVFAKSLTAFNPEQELTEEELKALNQARAGLTAI